MEKLYRIAEVTKILSVSRKKLYKMISEGELRVVKIGGMIRIPESAIQEAKK